MRLGLFGGRFDPPHLGHLIAAEWTREALELDELWFVPAKAPPHKSAAANAEQRYEMTTLAARHHPRFRVSRLELDREGPSFTIDTLLEVRRLHPSADLFFITGADAYRAIASWHRPDDVVNAATMVAVTRPGFDLTGLERRFAERVVPLEIPTLGISSTLVRTRLREGRSVRYLVPDSVETYLDRTDLYREPVQPQ